MQDWSLRAAAGGASRKRRDGEAKRAWRIRRETLDLVEDEDSSAAKAEDAKFGLNQGFIIDPTAVADAGRPGDADAGRKTRDSG